MKILRPLALLSGCAFYFAVKGDWTHAPIAFAVVLIAWFFYFRSN